MVKRLVARREQTGDRQLDTIQRNTERAARHINACPFLVGVLRSVQLEASVPKAVSHGLGQRAACIVVRSNYDGSGTPSSIAEGDATAQATVDLNSQLSVVSDEDCLVDLWFYPLSSEVTPR